MKTRKKFKYIKITAIIAIFTILISSMYINQNIQISKLSDGKENLDSQTVETGNINSLPIEGKTIINKASEILGAPYTLGGKGGLHAYDKGQATLYDASTVRSNGLDCSGLVWWTLTSLKFSTSGFSFQNPVPVDANHWYYTDVNETQKFSSNSNAYITYGGQTAKVEALAIEKMSGYYYDMVSGNIPMGTVFSSAPYGNSQNGHMWIYIGNLGTSNKEEAINKLKELGININDSNKDYVESKSDSTHWIIESYGGVGVRITNNNYKYGDTVSEGKVIGATWAFQVVPENPKGSYHLNLVKKDLDDDQSSVSDPNGYGEALSGAEFTIKQYINKTPDSTKKSADGEDYANWTNIVKPFVTDPNGKNAQTVQFGGESQVNIDDTKKCDYYRITETKAPDGYTKRGGTIQLAVHKKQNGNKYELEKVVVTWGKNKAEIAPGGQAAVIQMKDDGSTTNDKDAHKNDKGYYLAVDMSTTAITVTWRNPQEKLTGDFDLDLIKYVEGTTIPLAGAEFKVSVKDGTRELADTNKTYKTGSNGHFTEKVSGIGIEAENKTYTVTVTETKAPIGYEGISGPITFNVTSKLSSDGKSYVLTSGTPTTATNAKKVTVTEGQVLIEVENTPEGPHKGVKEVNNQDSGYYDEVTGKIYKDKETLESTLHDWVITSKIPSGIDQYAKYIITDPIDERLVFSGIESVKVVLLDGETLEEKETLTSDKDYKVNYDEETRTLKVSFIEDDFKAGQELEVGSIVEVRFNTTFAKDEEGNIIAINQSVENKATLTYGDNSGNEVSKDTETPEVHTGGVGLYKYDKKTGKALEGAKFKIATSKENAENGIFVKDANGNDIEKVTNEKGIAVFEGLEFGEDAMDDAKYQTGENIYGKPVYKYDWEKVETTYYIVETEAPTGYSKIEEPIEAVVKKDNYDITDIETLIKVGNESNIYDLALRKFITAVKDGSTGEEEKVTTRIPDVDIANLVDGTSTTATYTHPKDPVLVHTTDTVTYTIRIFNEGPQDAYASLVKDDIPDGLEFVTYTEGDGSVNDIYRWKLLDENDNEVTDISKAKYVVTDYLAMDDDEKNLIKGFDPDTMDELDYRDVQVQFKVVEPTTSGRILINYAQISEETDRNGNKVTDRDSTPNEWKGEDDEDIEKVRVLYFDLALRKWVTQAIVTENGQTVVTETGHKAEDDPEAVVKVDLKKSKLNNVTVKFRYSIRITNEGEIAGEATEIRDDIPNGLKFVAEDNPDWREENGQIVTNKLANTTLQPGESAEVEILLTWINSADNMGVMINVAEINKDHNVYGTPDIDSTPGNNVPGEDDIDDAPVMLTIKTGSEIITYTTLGLGVIAIIGAGVIVIKRKVLMK